MKVYCISFLAFLSLVANANGATTCFNGTIKAAGSTTVSPFASAWSSNYTKLCTKATVKVEEGGSSAGAKRVCGDATLGAVDIGMMSRAWKSSEATVQSDGYTYKCLIGNTTRQAAQLVVDNDAVLLIVRSEPVVPVKPAKPAKPVAPAKPVKPVRTPVKPVKPAPSKPVSPPSKPTYTAGSLNAAGCIKKLGCLTKDQIRWIFSNLTVAQLSASSVTWNIAAIPNSDKNDATRLWSELDSACSPTEIAITGTDSASGEYDFMKTALFQSTGETFRSSYVSQTTKSAVNTYVLGNSFAIGFNDFKVGQSTSGTGASKTTLVPIRGASACVTPSTGSVQDKTYTPLSRVTYMNVFKNNCTALKSALAYIEYGLTTAGQSEVTRAGGVPLSSTQVTAETNKITALRAFTGCTK